MKQAVPVILQEVSPCKQQPLRSYTEHAKFCDLHPQHLFGSDVASVYQNLTLKENADHLLGGGGLFISVWERLVRGKRSHGLAFEWLQPAGGKEVPEVASGAWMHRGQITRAALEPVHNAPKNQVPRTLCTMWSSLHDCLGLSTSKRHVFTSMGSDV